MLVYWIIIGVCSLYAVKNCSNIAARSQNVVYWSCCVALIVLSAVRSFNVGADTVNYCNGFWYIRRLAFRQALQFGWEQGYVSINWFLGRFFEDGRALVAFMAVVILVPLFFWMKQESEWPILSLVVFVCTGMWSSSMFIMRQWCAMAILTFSYKYIKQRKLVPFFILVFIAATFHRTAVIFILAYFIMSIPLKKLTVLFSVPVSAIIGLLGERILNILNRFARISEAGNFNGGISMLIVLWLFVFAVLICFKGTIPECLDFYFHLVFLAAFLQPIAFTFSNWSRIVAYFSISLSVFLPNFIVELTSEKTKNVSVRFPITVVFCVLMFMWFKIVDVDLYSFMWN